MIFPERAGREEPVALQVREHRAVGREPEGEDCGPWMDRAAIIAGPAVDRTQSTMT